jgi:hypothetical protein
MHPFPRIILTLRCPPHLHKEFLEDDLFLPADQWIGPREVQCVKRGKCGKKYLFTGLGEQSKPSESSLEAALSSLETVRNRIVPRNLGMLESATMKLLLSRECLLHVLLDSTTLAHIASFGMRLAIAVPKPPPTESELAEMRAEAKELGMEDFLKRAMEEPDDWER